ncbi:MAG: hypothetical protein KAH68_03630 [Draconibacterium sp.]|nr:hypothetical protein [Draconibacterium sp.]
MLSISNLRTYILTYNNSNVKQIRYILGFLLGIMIFTSVSAKPKELVTKYSIHILGANVGELSVIQINNNGNIDIEAITDIKVSLLFSYRIKYVQNTVYKKGLLRNSNIKTYKNGKLNSNMWIKYNKGQYLLVIDGDTTTINDSITYSGSLIYFNEPKAIKRIYKERTAEMRNITSESEHTYIIKDEKERELNKYYYRDGILHYAIMRHALGNLELKRISVKKADD